MKSATFIYKILAGLALGLSLSSCSKEKMGKTPPEVIPEIAVNWAKAADQSLTALDVQFYNTQSNYYNHNNSGNVGFNYWWNAHAMDVLVDAYKRTKDAKYLTKMDNLLAGCYVKNGNTYWNTFYDDMEWWALACLRAYDATKDEKYKTMARQYWTWIKVGWSEVKNGGIAWASGSKDSKNACSNAPAVIIASKLFQLDKNPDDLLWAKKIYTWLKTYVVESKRGLVYDAWGNTKESDMYTYNQGTWVGSGLELFQITGQTIYLDDALRTVNYLINDEVRYSPSGVLKGENTGDGGLFKGIFIRYMAQLILQGVLDDYTKGLYVKYLERNGKSLYAKATLLPENVFGPDWTSRPTSKASDSSVQLSGIILFEALDELKRANILK